MAELIGDGVPWDIAYGTVAPVSSSSIRSAGECDDSESDGLCGGAAVYEAVYGLVLNQSRLLLRRAHATAFGIHAALGGKMPEAWYDAIANSPEEAMEMQSAAEVEAHIERAWAQLRRG